MLSVKVLQILSTMLAKTVEYYEYFKAGEMNQCQKIYMTMIPLVMILKESGLDYEAYLAHVNRAAGERISEGGVLISQIRSIFVSPVYAREQLAAYEEFQENHILT